MDSLAVVQVVAGKNQIMKKFSWIFLLLTTLVSCQENKFPEPVGYVNDFENVFSKEEKAELTQIITDFEAATSNEIAIASIEEIGDYTDFNEYAFDLTNHWGVGKKGKDNGLTIIFSKNLRKIRINTGTQTQKILTDEICEDILYKDIFPEFKKGNYFIGIKTALLEFIKKWKASK